MPGDYLSQTENKSGYDFFCNNIKIAHAYRSDKLGNVLKHPEVTGVIGKNNYFLTTPHPKSFDSRYYGLINKADMIGKATLLI